MAKLRSLNKYSPAQDAASALGNKVSEWLEQTDPTDLWASCVTCRNMDQKTTTCKLFKIVPPARVIAGSIECRDYVDAQDIPF